jgi:chromatin segregation and condensation protein Rec8/ScpA/Scc1 (kleisin family)
MLGMRLVRLIEIHSEALARDLTERIRSSPRTSDFREIPAREMEQAISEVYRHLGEWLLQKTEGDIARRFKAIAARRVSQGIRLPQFVSALMLSRDHVWRFLQREAFADSIVELHGELELYQHLNQFFDHALYYAVVGYQEAQAGSEGDLRGMEDIPVSVRVRPSSSSAL